AGQWCRQGQSSSDLENPGSNLFDRSDRHRKVTESKTFMFLLNIEMEALTRRLSENRGTNEVLGLVTGIIPPPRRQDIDFRKEVEAFKAKKATAPEENLNEMLDSNEAGCRPS
ncbi:hypothetical protein PPACK8108_LOCUS15265, partial [Phakopsora pachyrhizi]